MTDAHLPDSLPVLPGVMLTARYLLTGVAPVSRGDTLDAVRLPGRRLGLMVADVVGHGVVAAVAAAQIRALLRERLVAGAPLDEVMESVDRQARGLPETCAATACVAVLDLEDGRLRYALAGHPAPLVIPARGMARPLPEEPSQPFGTGGKSVVLDAQVAPGDVLALYTDGLLTLSSPEGEDSRSSLVAAVGATSREQDPALSAAARGDAICREILGRAVPDVGCLDDAALLLVERTPRPEPLSVTVEATPENLAGLRTSVERWLDGVGAGLLEHVGLGQAVSELVENVVRHAYAEQDGHHAPGRTSRPMTVRASLEEDGSVAITVADRGRWRERDRAAPGGRGLMVAAGLTREFRVHRQPSGTVVRLGQPLGRPVPLLQAVAEPTDAEASVEEWSSDLVTEVDTGRLAAAGPVDLLAADAFHEALQEATLGGTRSAVVDLSRVSYLSSAAVQSLFEFIERTQRVGAALRIEATAGTPARHVLRLVGLPHTT